MSKKEMLKLLVLAVFLGLWFLYYSYMGGLLEHTRSKLASFPLSVVLPVYLAISAVRKLVPPCYYMAPMGTIFTIYMADNQGVAMGAFIYQVVKLQDILCVLRSSNTTFRYLTLFFSSFVDTSCWCADVTRQ